MSASAVVALDTAVQAALSTPAGPAWAATALQLRAVVEAVVASAPDHEQEIGDWLVVRQDRHLSMWGPTASIWVSVRAGQPSSLRVTSGQRSIQVDYGDHSQGDTAGTALERALSGDLRGAATGIARGMATSVTGIGASRVRLHDGPAVTGDWSFSLTGAVDHLDVQAQVDDAGERFRGALEGAGDPESPPISMRDSVEGMGSSMGAAGGVATAAAASAAAAALRLAARAAAQAHRQRERESSASGGPSAEPAPAGPPAARPRAVAVPTIAPAATRVPPPAPTPSAAPPPSTRAQATPAQATPAQAAPAVPVTWQPDHVVPGHGVDARSRPDPALPVIARLDGGLPVHVDQHWGEWAEVTASNGWRAWVDARSLLPLTAPTPAPAPAWHPDHMVPVGGLDARLQPDPALPVIARLDAGLPVRIDQHWGEWAEVTASNGWRAWVDARSLLPLPPTG